MAKSDSELLEQLIQLDHQLSGPEVRAFSDMLDGITSGKWEGMTERQRKWANQVAARVGLDEAEPEAENLVSSGKLKVQPGERERLSEFLGTLHRPLKPPGR